MPLRGLEGLALSRVCGSLKYCEDLGSKGGGQSQRSLASSSKSELIVYIRDT